jgi:anaerobic selenocysteine-containing dehydrogenase
MKIDRRSFLSLVIGGAAGIHLTPLPWKLADDSAIWTQTWPWTPVPEDGEASFANSTCTLCPGGCGITVRKIDDRAVKIEGMKGHPVNDGGICILGLAGLQLLYGPTRVGAPLERTGDRGAGKWQEITWEKAVEKVVKKLADLRTKGRPHTVGCMMGTDRGTVAGLFRRFMTVYGSPNFIRTPSMQDSYEFIMDVMHGRPGAAGFDVERADFVLSFGSGIIDGWGSPVRMFRAHSRWRENGGTMIQIEPRLSNTAAKADQWVPIKPGTESVLALGLANVMITRSLYNKRFVDKYTFGFEGWTDRLGKRHKGLKDLILAKYNPDEVEAVTGVTVSTILQLARKFAKASRPMAICGRGQGRTPGASGEFMAVHILNALVGRINRPGGVVNVPAPDYINWPAVEMDGTAAKGRKQARIDDARGKTFPYSRYLPSRFFEKIASDRDKAVQALLVSGANPLYTMPDVETVKKAFDRIPFIVSFSSYRDETSEYADLILPNHVYLERYEDVPTPAGYPKPFIGLSRPVVAPLLNTKHVGDTLIAIARKLGGNIAEAFSWESYEDCLKEAFGRSRWNQMIEKGFWSNPAYSAPAWRNSFDTASGRLEFAPSNVNNGSVGLFERPEHFAPVEPRGEGASYPLVLIPYDIMRLAGGFIGNPPFITKTVGDTVLKGNDSFVELNPKTAGAAGLTEGSTAILTTPKGSAKVKVHLFDGIMPGIVAMPRGLGHTAYDDYLAEKGINFNRLVGPVEDPASGFDTAWGIRAKLTKA